MLKKNAILGAIIMVMFMLVACSDNSYSYNNDVNKELTYEEEVAAFGNKISQLINTKDYEKVCDYWSQAYVKIGEKRYQKNYKELIKEYRVKCSNLNLEDASLNSVDICKNVENENIYTIVMSVYFYNEYNKRCYAEETLYVFKEGGKIVFADVSIPIEDVIKLSKLEYDFDSPVTVDE